MIASALVSVTNDPDGTRRQISERFGVAGQAPSYRAMLDRGGVVGAADLLIAGDEAAVESELQRYADAGTTELIAYPVGSTEEQARTVVFLAGLARQSCLAGAGR